MKDIKPIRVFIEVAKHMSFIQAARNLRMTPASVTRIISRLEEMLGQQLFVRTTRQVSLTSAGAMVLAKYQPVIEDFDRIGDELLRANRSDCGKLRINAPLSLGMRVLPGLTVAFQRAFPQIALDIQLSDAFVDIIESDYDLAIRISGPPSDKSTIWRKLCQIPLLLLAAPQLFDAENRPKTPDDLANFPLLSYSTKGKPESWTLCNGAQKRVIRAGETIIANNGDYLLEVAMQGGGICVLPSFIAEDALKAGRLEQVLPDWSAGPIWLTLFYPPYEQLPPLVSTFSDFFEAYLRDMSGLDFSSRL